MRRVIRRLPAGNRVRKCAHGRRRWRAKEQILILAKQNQVFSVIAFQEDDAPLTVKWQGFDDRKSALGFLGSADRDGTGQAETPQQECQPANQAQYENEGDDESDIVGPLQGSVPLLDRLGHRGCRIDLMIPGDARRLWLG